MIKHVHAAMHIYIYIYVIVVIYGAEYIAESCMQCILLNVEVSTK